MTPYRDARLVLGKLLVCRGYTEGKSFTSARIIILEARASKVSTLASCSLPSLFFFLFSTFFFNSLRAHLLWLRAFNFYSFEPARGIVLFGAKRNFASRIYIIVYFILFFSAFIGEYISITRLFLFWTRLTSINFAGRSI